MPDMNDGKLERLNIALDTVGLPIKGRGKTLVEATGYSQGMISRFLSGKDQLNDRFIKTVCRHYGINETFIVLGEGDIESGILSVKVDGLDDKIQQKIVDSIMAFVYPFLETASEAELYRFYADILEGKCLQIVRNNGDVVTIWEKPNDSLVNK
jgi:hypothetical protein